MEINLINLIIVFILLVVFFTVFYIWFNRTPKRNLKAAKNEIISPAHGTVIGIFENNESILTFTKNGRINKVEMPAMTTKNYKSIIIKMNLKNVHVQRAPIDGKIIYQKHVQGKFKNAVFSKNLENLAEENEKIISFFKNKNGLVIGVIQVAGVLARRIQSFYKVGDFLKRGDKFGRIKFGSQVVVIVPSSADIYIKKGDKLIDGETIIASVPF